MVASLRASTAEDVTFFILWPRELLPMTLKHNLIWWRWTSMLNVSKMSFESNFSDTHARRLVYLDHSKYRSIYACGRRHSNCRSSHVSEHKTLNVSVSHHYNSTSVSATTSAATTKTAVVVEDSSTTEASSAAHSAALPSDDDDDDAAEFHPVRWWVGLTDAWHRHLLKIGAKSGMQFGVVHCAAVKCLPNLSKNAQGQ